MRAMPVKAAPLGALATSLSISLALALPRVASACYVCISGRDDDSQRAFIAGSILLSVLPFFTFGGIGWYVRRRSRQIAESEGRSATAAPSLPKP
jgi:hypothetical protein